MNARSPLAESREAGSALHITFEQAESERTDYLNQLAGLSEAQLSWKPSALSWSINQVLLHLQESEAGIVRYIRKKSQAERLPQAGLNARVRSGLLTLIMRSPVRYSKPAGLPDPDPAIAFDQIRSDWDATREDFAEFIRSLPAEKADGAIFRHPFAGYFNLKQTLQFMEDHFRHHQRQVDRIRANAGFPANG